MAQIKKKFIQDGAVDGQKLLLLNNQPVKAKDGSGVEQELFKLDGSGVLQLLKMPELPSQSPSSASTIAPKAYVDSEVGAESAARIKADNGLQSQIDTEKGRIDAILSASEGDKDSFAEIVALINSVDTTNDNAFAAYVLSNDAALAQEIKDRQAEDSALDGRLDVLEADPVTKKYVDAAISAEQTVRGAEDTALDGRLEILEGDNTVSGSVAKAQADAQSYADGLVSTEAAARSKGDSDLSARIDSLELDPVSQSAVTSAINAEAAAREKADNDLDARLDIIEGADTVEGSVAKAEKDAKDYSDGIVASEASARSKADTDLQGQITTEKGRIDAILSASETDKDSFAEIVALINSVDTTNDSAFAGYVLSNDAALAQEIKDRQSGDNALDGRLDVLEADPTTKGYVDGQISGEAAARTKADNELDSRLDVLEADPTTKTYVDGQISGEASARAKADNELDGRLDVLEADPTTKSYVDGIESALDGRLDVLEAVVHQKQTFTMPNPVPAYVELDYEAKSASTVVFVGRLGAIEGVDYTVSVVGGKTRLTWIGELASGGASELAEGDKVHVKYMK